MTADEAKFKELVIYVAEKSVSDPDFGATKLNKILYFTDFLAYASLGSSVTGVEYQRLRHGPAPRRLLPLQRELVDARDVAVVPVSRGFTQNRIVPLRTADLSRFKPDEVALVDQVIEVLRGQNAQQVSELSHNWSLAWQALEDGDAIPYETVFWGPSDHEPETSEFAWQVAKEHDLIRKGT